MDETKLKEAYRQVFSSAAGEMVLADILNLCGYFNNVKETLSIDLIALANTILSRINVIDSTDVSTYVRNMIRNAPPIKQNNEED